MELPCTSGRWVKAANVEMVEDKQHAIFFLSSPPKHLQEGWINLQRTHAFTKAGGWKGVVSPLAGHPFRSISFSISFKPHALFPQPPIKVAVLKGLESSHHGLWVS